MVIVTYKMHQCKYCRRMIRGYAEHCDSPECIRKAAAEWAERAFRNLKLAELLGKP